MPGDDLTQQLADHLLHDPLAPVCQPWAAERYARAVLASGLVVPTGDVLNLAQQWDTEDRQDGRRLSVRTRELRALTQQETP